jgi:predicted transcriptional regulator
MKTIEIDDQTATALKQRAEERGLSVPELIAELATLEVDPVEADEETVAELDRRWQAFGAQSSVTSNDDVVKWLQTWGTPAYRRRNKQ